MRVNPNFVVQVAIFCLLGAILVGVVSPPRSVAAAPAMESQSIQSWGTSNGLMILYSPRTGEVWSYSAATLAGKNQPTFLGRLTELGQPGVK